MSAPPLNLVPIFATPFAAVSLAGSEGFALT